MAFLPEIQNVISDTAYNSRAAANLAAFGTFQGVSEDVSKYGRAAIAVTSSNSTDGTLTIQVSHDGVTWGGPDRTWADTRIAQPHMWNIVEKYFRILYTNGSTLATDLAIQVQYSVNANVVLGHQLNETLLAETEAQVTRSILVGKTEGGDYINVPVNGAGELMVALPKTAFGELSVEHKTPQVQIRFPYDMVSPDIGETLTNKVGSGVTVTSAQAEVTCGAIAESFSQIRTLDTVRYGPGQGAVMMGTCQFTAGETLSSQIFGAGDDDEGLFFGYDGPDFGVLRKSFGSLEILSLEILTGESTGAGNITITIDGTAVVIPVGSGDTIADVCAAIVADTAGFGNAGRGWEVHTNDNVTVEFISFVAENALGTFSFVDTDGTGVTASAFTTTVTGVSPTSLWIPQASWNKDTMISGNPLNPSGMTLDPTNGNVYKIQFQYLGYGGQEFFIENPATDELIHVHTIEHANANTIPWCRNPTFHLTLIAMTDVGYAGGALTMKTASMAGFIQGVESTQGVRRGVAIAKAMTTTETCLLILHNELDFNGFKNKITVFTDFVNVSHNNTNKVMTVRLIKNPTLIVGATALTNIESGVSVMAYSTTGTTVSGGQVLLTFEVAPGSSTPIDVAALLCKLRPGERYAFTGEMQSGTAIANVATTWVERV